MSAFWGWDPASVLPVTPVNPDGSPSLSWSPGASEFWYMPGDPTTELPTVYIPWPTWPTWPAGADWAAGPAWPAGADWAAGPAWPTWPGVASWWTTGQLLKKKSWTDYDTEWKDEKGYWLIIGATKADYIVDGTADNVQVQAAIDDSNALGWGTVWLNSTLLSTGASIVPKNGVTLRSMTWKTEIRAMSNIGYIFFSSHTTTLTNFKFKDIIFNVNGQVNNSWIQILRFDWLDIEDCVMKNSNAIWGIKVWHKATTDDPSVHKSKNLRIRNLHFEWGNTATYEGLLYLNVEGVSIDGVTENGFSGAALISSYIWSTDVTIKRVIITPNASMMAIDVTMNDKVTISDSSYINTNALGRTWVMIRNSRGVNIVKNHLELTTTSSDYWIQILDWAWPTIDGHSIPPWNSGWSENIDIDDNHIINTNGIVAHRNDSWPWPTFAVLATSCTVKDLYIHDNTLDGPFDTGIRVGWVTHPISWNIDNLRICNNIINGRTSLTNDMIAILGTATYSFRGLYVENNTAIAAGWNTDCIVLNYVESGFVGQNTLTPSGTWVAYNVSNSPNIKWHTTTQMTVTSDKDGVKLSGDSTTPGENKFYGTDNSGIKGWYDVLSHATYTVGATGCDYPTIQWAVDAATTGGLIAVMDGTYASFVFKYDDTRIVGTWLKTSIQADCAITPTLVKWNTSGISGCSLENFVLANINATAQGLWLDFSNMPRNTYRNIFFFNLGKPIRGDDTANQTFYNKFYEMSIYECIDGIDLNSTNPINDNQFYNTRIALKAGWGGKGLYMNKAQWNSFYDLNVEPGTGAGITGIHLDTVNCVNTTFINIYAENNNVGINIAWAQRTTFIGGMAVANTTDITDTGLDTTYIWFNKDYALFNQMVNMDFYDKSNASRIAGRFRNNTSFAHVGWQLVDIELLNPSDTSDALRIKNAWSGSSISVMQGITEVMNVGPDGITNVPKLNVWGTDVEDLIIALSVAL